MEPKIQAAIGKYWGFHCPGCAMVVLIAPEEDGQIKDTEENVNVFCSQCQMPVSYVVRDQKVLLL